MLATEAHLHRGSAGASGDVVLKLQTPRADGSSPHECIRGLGSRFIKTIKRNPSDFYVNVHTDEFPDGAIRGQLSK